MHVACICEEDIDPPIDGNSFFNLALEFIDAGSDIELEGCCSEIFQRLDGVDFPDCCNHFLASLKKLLADLEAETSAAACDEPYLL